MPAMSTAEMNGLPDACFAYIEPGGKKADGKTDPRSKRHLPYKKADGGIDLPHLRNALARLDETKADGLDAAKKKEIRAHLEKLLAKADKEKTNSLTTALDIAAVLAASSVPNAAGAVAADAPAEGWYQVDMAGQWDGHPSGAYKLTPADIRCIVDHFNTTCKANSVELPVDYEHQGIMAQILGKSAESGGWINALEARANDTQLWAHIRWVDDALALIRGKKFRYLSSHLMQNRKDATSGKRVPWMLDSVALTNRPFKKELPAVANSDAAASGLEEEPAQVPNSAVAEQEGTAMKDLLALLATAMSLDAKAVANSLGVPEDAQADAVVPALATLLHAGDVAARQVKLFANSIGVPETADVAAITAALAAKAAVAQPPPAVADADVKLLAICNSLGATPDKTTAELLSLLAATRANPAQAAAERMIENAISAEHKITPANREAFLKLAIADLEGTRKILDNTPAILNSVSSPAASESAAGAAVLTDADRWAMEQLGIKEVDYLATKTSQAR